jgi:hypothetical protein
MAYGLRACTGEWEASKSRAERQAALPPPRGTGLSRFFLNVKKDKISLRCPFSSLLLFAASFVHFICPALRNPRGFLVLMTLLMSEK